MDYAPEALHKEWKEGRFRPVYFFVGDPSRVAEALDRLKSDFKAADFDFSCWNADLDEKVDELIADALTPPLMGPRRLVLVENPKIPARARAALKDYLENPLATTTLVLVSEDRKPDPKDALARAAAAKGAVCLCAPLKEADAQKRLLAEARMSGKTLAPEAAAALVAEAGTDWPVLKQELEKAVLFAGASTTVEQRHVLECLGYQKALDPFAFPRFIRKRDLVKSLRHFRGMLRAGKKEEQAYSALNMITGAVLKQYRGKWMFRSGRGAEDIFRALRLNSWYDRDFTSELKALSDERLRQDLELCLRTETALKSRAWLDCAVEVEQLVGALCRVSDRA